MITSHASQAKTVDCVLIGQSAASFGASSKEQFYVSTSRGRSQARVFTDSRADLIEAVARSDERLSATELLARPELDAVRRRIIQHQYETQRRTWETFGASETRSPMRPGDHDLTFGRSRSAQADEHAAVARAHREVELER